MDHNSPSPAFSDGPYAKLAYLADVRGTDRPGLLWLGGYGSDMRGTKAEAVAVHAAQKNQSYCRFDYAGHGESEGPFEDGTITRWTEDAQHILDHHTDGPQILIGSSMGAWLTCRLALQRPERFAGAILIAPAPDFTTELTPKQWNEAQNKELRVKGRLEIPSEYDDTVMIYTLGLFVDGKAARVLNAPLPMPFPVRIISGMADDVVPWQHALRLAEHIYSPDLCVHLTKGGDHRMSGPSDLTRLMATIDELSA